MVVFVLPFNAVPLPRRTLKYLAFSGDKMIFLNNSILGDTLSPRRYINTFLKSVRI